MNDDPIHKAHDRFVRHLLSRPETAAGYLRQQLPADVVRQLDLSALRPVSQSFVDATLRESLADLVFEIPLVDGGEAVAVILFEHKSYPDPLTPFQVLRYIVRILDQRLREKQSLCCVIPLVLYHGEQGWNVARTMEELVVAPDSLRAYVPKFTLPLWDLSRYPEDRLREESILWVLASVLKYSQREELHERLVEVFHVVEKSLQHDTAFQTFEAILRYLMSASSTITPDQLRASYRRGVSKQPLLTEGLSIMPTIAEQLRQEGLEQGRAESSTQARNEGRTEGRAQGALIGRIQTLAEILGRSVGSFEELSARDEADLRQLAEELKAAVDRR